MPKYLLCVILILILGFTNNTNCQSAPDTTKRIMTAVRIDQPISLTGKMDNPEWLRADPVELKYEVTPGENIKFGLLNLFSNQFLSFIY